MVLGVLNVIAAVFVEGALSKAKGDRQLNLFEEQAKEKQIAAELVREFKHMDISGSGIITYEEWSKFLQCSTGRDFLKVFGVTATQSDELFKMLDIDDNGNIQIDEFVAGFMQIYGSVSRLDVQSLVRNNKRLLRKCIEYIDNLGVDSGRIASRLGGIERVLNDIHANTRMLPELGSLPAKPPSAPVMLKGSL
jgi:hypothetical protein